MPRPREGLRAGWHDHQERLKQWKAMHMVFPTDVFTERDAAPDTLAHLGLLRRLAGVWEGRGGVDINPKANGWW